jgi:integrase/recombinase XerD
VIQRRLRYLYRDVDRHGNVRWYVSVKGARKRRVRGDPDSPDFIEEYANAVRDAKLEASGIVVRPPGTKGTVAWLVDRYLESAAFGKLGPVTQERRRRVLEAFRQGYGGRTAGGIHRQAVKKLMDKWESAHGPFGANDRLKALRGLYGWALDQEHVDRDPTREVKRNTPRTEGIHTWTPAEIRRFMARWPLGTAPRVAMVVMLYTGARRGDAFRLGPQYVYRRRGEDRLRFTPAKTEETSGLVVDIPVRPELKEALAAGPTCDEAWIVGHRGRPFQTKEAFGVSFKRWCGAAGLPQCSAHGLRKGGAKLLAESGLTPHQLMAIYGWTGVQMAELYTRQADRARLGDALSGEFGLEEEGE